MFQTSRAFILVFKTSWQTRL